jgi:transketolase
MNERKRELTKDDLKRLKELSRLCRGDIIKMTSLAGSGHPGGAMSSIDMYLALYSFARIAPDTCLSPERDRIVISHGHTSPGAYAALARLGFMDTREVILGFRRQDSPYEGHVVRPIPGIEWSSGNLGQGLAAGCGYALAARMKNLDYHTYVVMSDGEQAKGQVAEARRFARKFGLTGLTVLIDHNHLQISGRVEDIMPVNIKDNYLADGWRVLDVPGHDHRAIFEALKNARADDQNPCAIICATVMGRSVSFMENKPEYHGRPLNQEECGKALAELGIENDMEKLKADRDKPISIFASKEIPPPRLEPGQHRTYPDKTDPRQALGNALEDLARLNPDQPIAVFDCDLSESVQTVKFAKLRPQGFFEAGVSEHSTATIAGSLSVNGIAVVWGDFGVFGLDEVYNQLRLNDINHSHLKIVATHLGWNVGPDGKTHQCIDYLSLLRNLFGFRLVLPADANQADHILRYVMNQPGNWVIGCGRTKLPPVKDENGRLFFGPDYEFEYGRVDQLRNGDRGAAFAMGPITGHALEACEILKKDGIRIQVYNVSSPLDLDPEVVKKAAQTGLIITAEDHNVHTGLGDIAGQIIADNGIKVKFKRLGVNQYGASADADALYRKAGLDAASLAQAVRSSLS